MKKMLLVTIAVIAVLTIGAVSVFAAGAGSVDISTASGGTKKCPAATECINKEQCGRNYEDNNKDGICDNYTGGKHLRDRAGHRGNGCENCRR